MVYRNRTLSEKYLEKRKIQTNRQLNIYHKKIKDKGRGFGRTRDRQERKAIVTKLCSLEN